MSGLLIDNVGALVTNDPTLGAGPLGLMEDAAILFEDGVVRWAGPRRATPEAAADERVDAGGRALIPGFVDSHAHLVFAGDRTAEFVARMSGEAYEAGGIRTTVAATRAASSEALGRNMGRLVAEALGSGTTTIECKSGYGLTVEDERRSVEIAAGHTDEVTYMGAHVVAPEYADRPDDYVELVCGAMLDACAPHSRWIDVFCERGAFDRDQTRAILRAGVERGLLVRVHANQLEPRARACRSPSSSMPPRPTTPRISTTTTLRRWLGATPWPRSCRRPSSPRAPPIPTRAVCSTPERPSRWPPTATRARASPPASRSASPSPYGRWG